MGTNAETVLLIYESHFSAIALYYYTINYFVTSRCCSSLLGPFVDALAMASYGKLTKRQYKQTFNRGLKLCVKSVII